MKKFFALILVFDIFLCLKLIRQLYSKQLSSYTDFWKMIFEGLCQKAKSLITLNFLPST